MFKVSRFIMASMMLLALLSCDGAQVVTKDTTGNTSVPSRYQALYHELHSKLRGLHAATQPLRKNKGSDTAFGVELLVANSNRGEVLLKERVFKATVFTLDRLKDLGVQGVALSIQYPLLTQSFPRSIEYRDFYRRVAQEVRRRNLALIVEIGTMFREPEFSSRGWTEDLIRLET